MTRSEGKTIINVLESLKIMQPELVKIKTGNVPVFMLTGVVK